MVIIDMKANIPITKIGASMIICQIKIAMQATTKMADQINSIILSFIAFYFESVTS